MLVVQKICIRNKILVLEKVPLLYDNDSDVKLANNPLKHSIIKHVDLHRHLLRDHIAKGDILLGVKTDDQLANVFTKTTR